VGRRTNYGFEKKQRELKKQKKKEAKAERKRLAKEGLGEDVVGEAVEADVEVVEATGDEELI
jgi:hypothetical protein